ncbi:MAG: hypothetical protein JWM57_3084 [Phycisphaerales bacterium]|nr:hypothetical protein [Phycisphaerales bacterium]
MARASRRVKSGERTAGRPQEQSQAAAYTSRRTHLRNDDAAYACGHVANPCFTGL